MRLWIPLSIAFALWSFSGGAWAGEYVNLSHYDASKIPSGKFRRLTEFYPLGFSKSGWFAYSTEVPPALSSGISLVNIRCPGGGECVTDTPSSKGDVCYCPTPTTLRGMRRYGVRPLGKFRHGSLPGKIGKEDYRVETVYKEGLIPSEMAGGGAFPGIEVYLVSKNSGKVLLTVIDPNHQGARQGSIQGNDWMETPIPGTIIVLVSYIVSEGSGQEEGLDVVTQPVIVQLKGISF